MSLRLLLNIIWLVFAGVWLALGYLLAAVVLAITITPARQTTRGIGRRRLDR